MNIQPIVGGYGELAAVPILLRRLRDEFHAGGVDVNRPIRRRRSELVQEAELRRTIRLAQLQPNCDAILILRCRAVQKDISKSECAPKSATWNEQTIPL